MSRLELLPFRHLLDDVVDIARPHFRRIYPTIAVPVAVSGAILALGQDRFYRSISSGEGNLLADSLLAMGGFFLVLGVFMWAFICLYVISVDVVAGREVSLRRAWLFPLRPTVFLTLVLTTVLSLVSLLLCLVPAIVVWPLLALVIPVMVEEERYGFSAISRSASLARWNGTGKLRDSSFLQVLALLFVGWLVQNALGLLIQGPAAVLQNYLTFRDGLEGLDDPLAAIGPLWLVLPVQVANALIGAAAWFYWTFGFSVLYRELRRRRESPDLRRAVDELTASTVEARAP